MPSQEFSQLIQDLWEQVLPLYEQLHCYANQKLGDFYGVERVEMEKGYLPAHLLGNMWGQDWINIYDLLIPFPKVQPIDITPELLKQNYDAQRIHRMAEDFYVSCNPFSFLL